MTHTRQFTRTANLTLSKGIDYIVLYYALWMAVIGLKYFTRVIVTLQSTNFFY